MADLEKLLVSPDVPIREIIELIDRNAEGIVLVVDTDHRLLGTVTDGDIRRAILDNMDLGLPAQVLLERRVSGPHRAPVTAPVGTPDAELLDLMNHHVIRHIPLLDEGEKVVDVALLGELTKLRTSPLTAVVMTGGYGTRLRPLTEELPKSMLSLGGRPLLERTIDQLRSAGISRVKLATHFEGQKIVDHFGDGSEFGVEISYLNEDRPLGTAGALGLLDEPDEPLLVINGDILTGVDFEAIHRFHTEHRADMTVGVAAYDIKVPYGVVETHGVDVTKISEKPVMRHLVNAGIYLLDPGVSGAIPNGQPYDMTELITQLVSDGRRVVSFPILEYWLDIGQLEDYEQAQDDVRAGKVSP